MNTKNINAILILALIGLALLMLSGRVEFSDLTAFSFTKSALRWRLAWLSLGAAVGFIIVWGSKLSAEKALWGAILCAILAYLLF